MEAPVKHDKVAPLTSAEAFAAYFRDPTERADLTRRLFDTTAHDYEHLDRILSFGSGVWYRRRELRRAGLRPGMRVLDVAVGTGLVARQAVAITGEAHAVVGLDVSRGMLREVRRHVQMGLIQGGAEQLPFADCSFDLVSMGYALRHLADLHSTFREFHRVLRPGGRLLILEIGRPTSRAAFVLAKGFLRHVAPWLTRWTTGSQAAQTLMQYYWETIEHCVAPATIVMALEAAAFVESACREEFALLHTYMGQKPAADGA